MWGQFPEWSKRAEKQCRGEAATEGFTFRPYVNANSLLFFVFLRLLTLTGALDSSHHPEKTKWTLEQPVWKSICVPTQRVSKDLEFKDISLISSHLWRILVNSCHVWLFMMCVDSVVERRALRETVFPKLREHCRHTLGLDVRVSSWCLNLTHCREHGLFCLVVTAAQKVLCLFPSFCPFGAEAAGRKFNKELNVDVTTTGTINVLKFKTYCFYLHSFN